MTHVLVVQELSIKSVVEKSKAYIPTSLSESFEAYNLGRLIMGIEEFNVMNKDANKRYVIILLKTRLEIIQ